MFIDEQEIVEQLIFYVTQKDPITDEVAFPDTVPEDLLQGHQYDGYANATAAEIVRIMKEEDEPMALHDIAWRLGALVFGLPDCISIATFIKEPLDEGRIRINEDYTFTLLW